MTEGVRTHLYTHAASRYHISRVAVHPCYFYTQNLWPHARKHQLLH